MSAASKEDEQEEARAADKTAELKSAGKSGKPEAGDSAPAPDDRAT
jgi:hypothetical protein